MAKSKERSSLLDFCRKLPGVTEDVKWEKDLVFSVGGKMFAVFGLPELAWPGSRAGLPSVLVSTTAPVTC